MPDEYQDRPGPRYGRPNGNMAYYTPQTNRWHESENFNIMEGAYNGPFADFVPNPVAKIGYEGRPGDVRKFVDDVVERRQVVLLQKAGLWIVIDRLASPAEHTAGR